MSFDFRLGAVVFAVLASSPGVANAQVPDPVAALITLGDQYRMVSNVTYLTANNWDAKLDVYAPRAPSRNEAPAPNPTLIHIHGGGWTGGAKESSLFRILPYIAAGWSVVNVEYRLARVSLAPAAVEDCRCALRWVHAHAKEYGFDTSRIVVTGESAGGHLALMTGMLAPEAGLDRQCPGSDDLKVAAIVNWYGIADVVDLLDGPNMKSYAVAWLAGQDDRETIARRASPLTYVRSGLPPIITIHGDADPTVPYAHALRLRDGLTKAGVVNELVTVPGGGHGRFAPSEMMRAYGAVFEFLRKQALMPKPAAKGDAATRRP